MIMARKSTGITLGGIILGSKLDDACPFVFHSTAKCGFGWHAYIGADRDLIDNATREANDS